MINENSVAAVFFFKLLIESVYEHVLAFFPIAYGIKLRIVPTWNVWKTYSCNVCYRTTRLQTLHGHLAFFGGMPASILQCSNDFYALKSLVSRILDITFTTSLPTKSYAAVVTNI